MNQKQACKQQYGETITLCWLAMIFNCKEIHIVIYFVRACHELYAVRVDELDYFCLGKEVNSILLTTWMALMAAWDNASLERPRRGLLSHQKQGWSHTLI